ncbi:phosphoesterase [Halobacteriales archaeon QH_10_67_13]|nr:MAG: phosphoesterase [Halobacteriales archaeon QH_10_67_13]
MYSLNVPVPSAVARRADQVAARLPGARRRRRGEHTLVVKRLGETGPHRLSARAREVVSGHAPFGARVTRIDRFDSPPAGSGPVVYLAVDSPAIGALHDELSDRFPPVADLEGDAYVPHVTVARGGDEAAIERVLRPIEPIEWTVAELVVWDSRRGQPVERIALSG